MTVPTIAKAHSQANPWQLRWKRPELLQRNVSDIPSGDARADHSAGIAISTASARLTEAEASEWLRRDNIPSPNDETVSHPEQRDDDSDAILTVTVLTSQPAINKRPPTVGDAVLLEVTTICDDASDAESSDTDAGATKGGHGSVKVLHSKLLQWPSSALGGIEAVGVRTTRGGGSGSNKKRKQKRRYVKQERGVQSVALCRRARPLSAGDSTVGGSSFGGGDDVTFSTLQTTASTYEQMSDALDTLSLLTMVVGDRPLATHSRRAMNLTSVPEQTAPTSINDDHSRATNEDVASTNLVEIDTDGHLEGATPEEETKELVVCFLSDTGVVHFFDPYQLLFDNDTAKNKKRGSVGMNDDQSFASLLFGGDLLSKIDATIAPLSEPAQTVLISQFEHMPSIIEEEGGVSDGQDMAAIASEFKALSLFDCTMEASTFHNVTVRNRPTTCSTAFGYVAIAGKGTRRFGQKRLRLSNDKATVGSPSQEDALLMNENGREKAFATESEQKKKERWEWEYDYVPGGFVTFISLEHYAVSRTVFLSFEPKSMYPIIWNETQFIVVLGEDGQSAVDGAVGLPNAVAICVDSRRQIRLAEKDPTPFRRFVPFAIDLSNTALTAEGEERLTGSTAISVTSMLTSPPSIISAAMREDGSALMLYLHSITGIDFAENPPVRSQIFDRQFAIVPLSASSNKAKPDLCCISGQGWSLICIEAPGDSCAAYFITWEGATTHSGAHVMKLGRFPIESPLAIVSSNVQPTANARCKRRNFVDHGKVLSDTHMKRNTPVKKALENHATIESTTAAVLNCTELDIGTSQEAMLRQQFLLANIHFGSVSNDGNTSFLAFRKLAVKHGLETTPCNYILSWLSRGSDDDDGVDYYTAACIALTLLQDEDAVRDLSSWDAIQGNGTGKRGKRCLDGILDGIVRSGEKTTDYAHSFSVESLADMAVACMVMGGVGMSTALEGFLGRNEDYDASRACLMLAATASSSINLYSDNEFAKILWPIKCLLRIGVARDCMPTALGLLNTSIPNELRGRASRDSTSGGRGADENTSSEPTILHLSKSIIAMILGSAPPLSAGCLLDLSETQDNNDEIGSTQYWQSLDHNTRMEFSTIAIERSQYPLLRETEVRSWALDQISAYFESSLMQRDDPAHFGGAKKKDASLPSEWIMEICLAILSNAGYCIEVSSAESPDSDLVVRTEGNTTSAEISSSSADTSTGGIDFNLLILALLALDQQPLRLNDGTEILAHQVLVHICNLAGLRSHQEPDFAFDPAKAIKQCARAENIPAVAALIGGVDGFVLKTANVLIKSLNLSMKQAELLLREGIFSGEALESNSETSVKFTLTHGHKQVLSLLQEHVLSVKSQGQIDCDSVKGHIDPIFAAKVLLRAWQALQQRRRPQQAKGSSNSKNYPWLETWLRTRLGMDVKDGCAKNEDGGPPSCVSRTACAAVLSRALLWPDETLAHALGFSSRFLTALAQMCCGVVEAVPSTVLLEQQ